MKKVSAVGVLLAAMLVVPVSATGPMFHDVPSSHWAYSYIQDMAQQGIVTGTGSGRFQPENSVSTAEFATMLCSGFYREEQQGHGGAWWQSYTQTLLSEGILDGTQVGNYYRQHGAWDENMVESAISRYDMAQMMYQLLLSQGMTMPSDQQRQKAREQIADYDQIPQQYRTAVECMYSLGCITGKDGSFCGNDSMKRAEACVVLTRLQEQLGQSGGQQSSGNQQSEMTQEDQIAQWEQEVFDLVNEIRVANGLEEFVYNETLAQTARAHSEDMVERGFFAHKNPDGQSSSDRMTAAGINWTQTAENIAAGYKSPEAVVEGWMNSPGHKANILGPCKEMGVGLAISQDSSDLYQYYWTQNFATIQ